MSLTIRILLIVVSLITFIYIRRKIKKSQMQVMEATYWILVSFFLLVLSVFPVIANYLSFLIGIESPVNFVFLSIIFILFVHEFRLSVKISKLEEKQKELVEELAIREIIKLEE